MTNKQKQTTTVKAKITVETHLGAGFSSTESLVEWMSACLNCNANNATASIKVLADGSPILEPSDPSLPNVLKLSPERNLEIFLGMLESADCVSVSGSPLLSSFTTSEPTGEASNEIVCFSWLDTDNQVNSCVSITEGDIANGTWAASCFRFTDESGNLTVVAFYDLALKSPRV